MAFQHDTQLVGDGPHHLHARGESDNRGGNVECSFPCIPKRPQIEYHGGSGEAVASEGISGSADLQLNAIRKLDSDIQARGEESAGLIDTIPRDNGHQSTALEEVTVEVRQMDEMTQHNAALVEQTNAAIEQTEAQASELDRIVDVFRMDGAGQSATPPAKPKPALRTVGSAALAPDWNEF